MKLAIVILLCLAPVAVADPMSPEKATAAKQACADAMNASPELAKEISAMLDRRIDAELQKVHSDAQEAVHKNEQHVIYAYIAMWLVAAGFVAFLWRRQLALRGEIDRLKADLDRAEKEST